MAQTETAPPAGGGTSGGTDAQSIADRAAEAIADPATAPVVAEATESVARWSLPVSDPVLSFAIMLMIILIAPMVLQRLRAPGMIGMILAGIIVGPNALNILQRSETIQMLGTVGLLYIIFTAAVSIDLHRFRRYRAHSLLFGSISFLVPQLAGAAMARWLLGFDWTAAILLGSMFGSHTLLSYPIANRLGLGRSPAVTTAVGGTIVTDTGALVVLAVVARSIGGPLDLAFWLTMTGAIGLYAGVTLLVLPRLGRWFFRTIPPEGSSHFVFLMAAVFVSAYFAQVAGLAPIFGAFLGGLALNRLVPDQSALMGRVEFAGSWLFIPIFLLSVGMLVDPRVLLMDIETWRVSIAMVVTVTVSKFVAAWLSRHVLRYSSTEGWVMFGLSVNQAAATLAAVIVGYNLGIFDDAVLNGTIMMILVTCIIGPWATQRFGRAQALAEVHRAEDRSLAPRRILIPLRNPEAAEAIMDAALLVHESDSREPLYPLTVVQDDDDASSQVAAAERMLGSAVMYAASANVPVVPVTRLDNNAAAGVARAIRELRISTVVMGWTGGNTARNRIFGSVLDQLLEQCPQQFVVCRIATPLSAAKRLVLAVPRFADREVGFAAAMGTIKTLASRAGLNLHVCAAESDLERLRESLPRIKPQVTMDFRAVPSISVWLDPKSGGLEPDELFVLLAARQHRISWQPSIDRLPAQVADRMPSTSMVVVYPPEEVSASTVPTAESAVGGIDLHELFRPERIVLNLDTDSPHAILERLLGPWFEGREVTKALLLSELTRVVTDAPIEIASGVVLLHARTVHVQKPMAFLATSATGAVFGRIAEPARAIIVLLTPAALEPSEHLQHLARIARLLSAPSAADRIASAASPEDLHELLTDPT